MDKNVFDDIIERTDSELTVIDLKPLDFNETVALTAACMKCKKVDNMTAAAIFGQTLGYPKYIIDFARFLKESDSNEPDGYGYISNGINECSNS